VSVQYGKYARRIVGEVLVLGDDDVFFNLSEWLLERKMALPYGGKKKNKWTKAALARAGKAADEWLGEA
jgi:hypothetical protein